MDKKNIQNSRRTGTIPKIKPRNNSSRQTLGQANINQEFEVHQQQYDSNIENYPHFESSEAMKLSAPFRKQSIENIGGHQRGDQKNEELGKQLNQIEEYLHMMLKNQQETSNENTSFKKMRNQISPNRTQAGYTPVKKVKPLTHDKLQTHSGNTSMQIPATIITNYNNPRNSGCDIQAYEDSVSNAGESVKSFNANPVEHLKSMNYNYSPSKKYILETLQKQLKNITEREKKVAHFIGSEEQFLEEFEILQDQIYDLDNKKKVICKLIMDIKNSEECKNRDLGGKVKKIAYMQQQLDDLKNALLMSENAENFDINGCCTKMDNIIHDEVKEKNHPHECYNGTCYFDGNQHDNQIFTKKQINKKNTVRNKEFLELQAEVNARKKELKNIISKTQATVNLNQHLPMDKKVERTENRFSLKDAKGNSFCSNSSENLAFNHLTLSEATSNNHIDNTEVNSNNGINSNRIGLNSYHPLLLQASFNKQLEDTGTPLTTDGQSINSPNWEFDLMTVPQFQPSKDCIKSNQMRNQLESIKMICETMLSEASGCNFNRKPGSEKSLSGPMCVDHYPQTKKNTFNFREGLGTRSRSSPTQSNSSKVENWMDANAVQTNAFMINSLHMCCEMLNIQQKEIVSLKKTVDSIQNVNQLTKAESGYSTIRTINSNHISPNEIAGTNNFINISSRPQILRKKNSTVENCLDKGNDQYCSDVNEEHISIPANFSSPKQHDYNRKNIENNFKIPGQCYHPSLHSSNENLQSQIWRTSQALNNQVAPGIRANNYWDNFRSYSRQNLLSRKCNEDFRREDLLIEDMSQEQRASNRSTFPVSKDNSFEEIPVPQVEVYASPENVQTINTSRRRNLQNDDFDVENKTQEEEFNCIDNNSIIGSFLNFSNESEDKEKQNCKTKFADQKLENIFYGVLQPDAFTTLNYPEVLHEKIYKEVALLISSNQNRLEYLIEVFKDLQFIKTDALRWKLLRKIKSLIPDNNQTVAANQNNEIPVEQEKIKEEEVQYHNACTNTTEVLEISTELMNIYQEAIPEIVDFLNNHDDEHLSHSTILALHQILNDITIPAVLAEVNLKTVKLDEFMSPLSHWLQNLNGKLIKNIKTRIFYKIHGTLNDMKQLEIIQKNEVPTNIEPTLDLPVTNFNGDLAEADQVDKELDGYEEGAVGGIISSVVDSENKSFWDEVDVENEPTLPFKVFPC